MSASHVRRVGDPDPRRREPLWDRVDRNRVKLAAYLLVFVAGVVVVLDIYLIATLALIALFVMPEEVLWHPPAAGEAWTILIASSVFALVAAAWATVALLRSERWLIRRLGAERVPRGELMDTKLVLKDIAIAAGLGMAPELYIVEAQGVNAFILARRRRAVVGVTRGFVQRLAPHEQRAVFANLVARIVSGDALVATAVTALLWPLQSWRMRPVPEDDIFAPRRDAGDAWRDERPGSTQDGGALVALILFGIVFAFLAEIVAAGHRHSQLSSAEKADAEGMLLLKDPASMLSALERCIVLDNIVPEARDTLGELFYCWPSFSTNDDEDPEWRRVSRLREVLGAAGVRIDTARDGKALQEAMPPVAPRIDG